MMDDYEVVDLGPEDTKQDRHVSNPYLDYVTGSKPPELVGFELGMSPYLNSLPNLSRPNPAPMVRTPRQRRRGITAATVSVVVLVPLFALTLGRAFLHFLPH